MEHEDEIKKFIIPNLFKGRDPGKLSFIIAQILVSYISAATNGTFKVNDDLLKEIIGVLESTKLSFYRRVVSPHEDEKLKESEDVLF